MQPVKILDEWQTIHRLLATGGSIARFGDGELKLCHMKAAKSQQPCYAIKNHLRTILKGKSTKCLVAIPRIYGRTDMTERKWGFWKQYAVDHYTSLYNKAYVYGSSFITRPDAAPIGTPEYWAKVKRLWAGRHVVVIQGVGTRVEKDKTFLEGAASVAFLYGPARDAYAQLEALKAKCLALPSDTLYLLALGPTATCLAYDLATVHGRQALDIGHMSMFYAKEHPKGENNNAE